MALARPRLWLVYKLIGEHCLGGVSAASRAPAAAAPAAPPLTLLDRLRLMGIAEAGATRVKPGESRARRCFHVVSPLDVGSRGLVLCTTSAALAQLLAARPATLARHLGAEDVYLRSRGGSGSSAAQLPLPPATAAAIAASRATIVTRRYRARLGALALAPHLAAAFASGRYGGSAGQPPIYIEPVGGGGAARGAAAAAGEGSGGGGGGSGGGPPQRKGSANVHVSITTTLDGKLLREALAQHGVMVSDLLRLAQGPFSLELGGALTPGSALEVQVPLQLAATAGRLARALRSSEEEGDGEAPVGAALDRRRSLELSGPV